jgi:hypothetical protein
MSTLEAILEENYGIPKSKVKGLNFVLSFKGMNISVFAGKTIIYG